MNRRALLQTSVVGAFGGLLPERALASSSAPTTIHDFPTNPANAPFPSPVKSRIIGSGGKPYLVDRFGTVFTLGTPTPGGKPVRPTYYPKSVAPSANVGYIAYANSAPENDNVAALLSGKHGAGWSVIYFTQLIMGGEGYCWAHAANGQWYKYTGTGFYVQGGPPSFATSTPPTAAPVTTGVIPALSKPANPAPGTSGRTLQVGKGKTYPTIEAAVQAAAAGDTIVVNTGTYHESFRPSVPVLLRARGAVMMDLSGLTKILAEGKGAIVPVADFVLDGGAGPDDSWRITGVAMDQKSSQFTACIRPDVGCNYMTVRGNVILENSQLGIAAGSNLPHLTILLDGITIQKCGLPDGRSHNVYVDNIRALVCHDVVSRDPNTAHAIKSRALYTQITGRRGFVNAANASPIDLPDGTAVPAFIGGITVSKASTDGNYNAFSQNEESTHNGTAGTLFGSDVVWEIACRSPFFQIGAGNVWNTAAWSGHIPAVQGDGKIFGF